MHESVTEFSERPADPELTQAQKAMKELCEEILSLKKPEFRMTYWDLQINADPTEVETHLRQSAVAPLMLKDGESFSMPNGGDYYPDLGLISGEAKAEVVSIRAWKWEEDKWRVDPKGPETPPYKLIEYPGEKDWTHELDIYIWYATAEGVSARVCQKICSYTGSRRAGTTPNISRDVWAMSYAETGYEGHKQESITLNDEEVLAFVAYARQLFESALDAGNTGVDLIE